MKVAIIGGGIAGLTQGIFLRQKGREVIVYERSEVVHSRGHAFLMSEDGMAYLNSFLEKHDTQLIHNKIDLFSLKRPNDEELIKISLDDWYCLKRTDLIHYLLSYYTDNNLKFGYNFSHFEYQNNLAQAVIFENGERIEADIFIGADGSNSAIRKYLFGETNYTSIDVKEVVGISSYSCKSDYQTFQKYQSSDKGLAFGFIPASEKECVWFMQYDVKFENGEQLNCPEELKQFCYHLLNDFPAEVKDVLDANNFTNSYVWNTRDFDLLQTFHKENVVLIGDAAHLALPFTSAGTTNAIKDAAILTASLSTEPNYTKAFERYYLRRKESLSSHVNQGRELKKIFLDPQKYSERGFMLPLISDKYDKNKSRDKKELSIAYFTDPICSTCWIFQPILRKLKLEYGDHIEIRYIMGGLLPNWESYNNKKITSPLDAAKLWDEMREKHEIPMDGDVWIEDPLVSSFPPSIAFKSAQLQNTDKAVSFLRRMKEMLFIEKKNINKWSNIEKAALFSGLDAAVLNKDMHNTGIRNFERDLELTKSLGIEIFPTLVFELDGEAVHKMQGLQSYEKLEKTISSYLTNLEKKKDLPNPAKLFRLFNNMTEKEFCFLLDLSKEEGSKILMDLKNQGIIDRIELKSVEYWKYR